MADKKISQLTAATTPLTGSEVLPIVQNGATVKVSVANLTAARVMSANGVAFPVTQSASSDPNTLDDYEEGTWTPTGFNINFTTASGKYTKVGNVVTCTFIAEFPSTTDGSIAYINGLPFTSASNGGVGMAYYSSDVNYAVTIGNTFLLPFNAIATAYKTNANLSTQTVGGSFSYQV